MTVKFLSFYINLVKLMRKKNVLNCFGEHGIGYFRYDIDIEKIGTISTHKITSYPTLTLNIICFDPC